MSKERAEWKVRLTPSNLNGQENARLVRLVSSGTRTLDDLVAIACDGGGCGIPAETLRAAAKILMNEARDSLLEGYTVSTQIGTLTPTVKGLWNNERLLPEARRQNTATVRYTPSPALRRSLSNPLFVETGGTGFRLTVYDVEDTATGTRNERLTPGRTIVLHGKMLLMNGDLPERGIYFVRADTGEAVRHVKPDELALCTRTRIIAIVPSDLPRGEYLIRVVSQCTTNPRPMKHAAEYVTKTPLAVE